MDFINFIPLFRVVKIDTNQICQIQQQYHHQAVFGPEVDRRSM